MLYGIEKTEEERAISTESLRETARFARASHFFKSWQWFSKNILENLDNFNELSTSNFEAFSIKFLQQSKNYPAHVKTNDLRIKFKKQMKMFWDLYFEQSLSYRLVREEEGEDRNRGRYKVVAAQDIAHSDILNELIGFVEPVENLLPSRYNISNDKEVRDELVNNLGMHYCSLVTFQDDKEYALFGPIAYVNNDCKSPCVYEEITEGDDRFFDTVYKNRRKTVRLKENQSNKKKDHLIYNQGTEITVRYVNEGEPLPFNGPCCCDTCKRKNSQNEQEGTGSKKKVYQISKRSIKNKQPTKKPTCC